MRMENHFLVTEAESGMRSPMEELESLVEQRTLALRTLSARLLRVQEEERRRLARELHDSAGQTLTALKIELAELEKRLQAQQSAPENFAQIVSLADQALREIRTTSYLLYPPLLEESGLCSAVRWYAEGFGQRSNIRVNLFLASIGRLSRSCEIALFRVLQESLTNIYRHSSSETADVRLQPVDQLVILEVRDYGKGMPIGLLHQFRQAGGTGVGLAGMRERIREIGGQLEVISDEAGTLIRATVPARDQPAAPNEITEPSEAFAA